MGTFGDRLREERIRLSLSQEDMAAKGGVKRGAQINYEKNERAPDANYMSSIANIGVDVNYILTGRRSHIEPLGSTVRDHRLGQTMHVVGAGSAIEDIANPPEPLDKELLNKIVVMLESAAKQAGKRWTTSQLIDTAALVYNFLIQEETINEEKIERTLKLVVNR